MDTRGKIGENRIIYEDPLTEKIPEGRAKLIGLLEDDGIFEHWSVRFQNHRKLYRRKIVINTERYRKLVSQFD